MEHYLRKTSLSHPGPGILFPTSIFQSPVHLRELHRIIRSDFARAEGMFCRPSMILGKEGHLNRIVSLGPEDDFIAEIVHTPDDVLLKVENEINYKPVWRIRAARDPGSRARNMKELSIYAPAYVRGKVGSSGPFTPLSARKADLAKSPITRTE